MQVSLPYVVRDVDRHGNVRLYFRRNGRKQRLRGPEGSPDFLDDYRRALLGELPEKAKGKSLVQSRPGTMWELISLYYKSAAYRSLDPRTRHVRAQILERFCRSNKDGEKPFASLEPKHLMIRRDAMMERPEAANGMLKALRQVFNFAVEYGHHTSNPAKLVKYLDSQSDGITAWSNADVDAFEAAHPVGTMAYLAMALALYTGQRKSDVIRLGPASIATHGGRDGFQLTQKKRTRGKPVQLWIPIDPELKEVLSLTPTGSTSFIITEFGRPFTEGGFGNRFRHWCDEAGLKGLSIHGLRKTASAILAENGCTEQEIMAITGHRTSKEVIRYTRSANQKLRAVNAIDKRNASK